MSAFPSSIQTGFSGIGLTAEHSGKKPARINAVVIGLLVSVWLIPMTGCYSMPSSGNGGALVDSLFTRHRDRVWAARAYSETCGGQQWPNGDHHRQGFIDGYCSVCRGGDGYVPAVPPKSYWTSQYQSEHGAGCVNSWFEGYPQGAEAAKKDNAGRFSDIYISQMLDSAITQETRGVSLPSDIKVVSDSGNTIPTDTKSSTQEQTNPNGPLPLPNRDWSMTFPDLRSAGSDGQTTGQSVR